MKPLKTMGAAAVVVLAVAALLIYLLLGNLNSLVESAIEDVGSEMTGSGVHLGGVAIDLSSGRGELTGLVIDNPPGYDSDFALKLDKVVLAIEPSSLTGPVIVLKEMVVKGAELNAEQKGSSSNLSELLASIEKAAGSSKKSAPADPSAESSETRLALKRFVFAGTKATLIVPGEEPKIITVPDVKRSNIGNPKTGLSSQQLADELLHAVIEEVQKAVGVHLAELAQEAAKDKIKEKFGLKKK